MQETVPTTEEIRASIAELTQKMQAGHDEYAAKVLAETGKTIEQIAQEHVARVAQQQEDSRARWESMYGKPFPRKDKL
jgi:acyl-CoA reductase-like NAD-dependent aldehyde dehydrogenase